MVRARDNVVRVDADVFKLARTYIANRAHDLDAIGSALRRRDLEAIYRIGHNLHGSGRMFGFDELSVIGAELQRAVAAQDTGGIAGLRARMAAFLSRVKVETQAAPRSLPKPVSPAPAAIERVSRKKARPPRVLLVDDDAMNRILVTHYLEKDGYIVKQASSGPEALTALERPPLPAVILLDVVMPGMSGFEVCRRLKSNDRTAGIPIVLLTALDKLEDRRLGMEAGADDFLCKPIARGDLLSRVCALARAAEAAGMRQASASN